MPTSYKPAAVKANDYWKSWSRTPRPKMPRHHRKAMLFLRGTYKLTDFEARNLLVKQAEADQRRNLLKLAEQQSAAGAGDTTYSMRA